MKRSSLSLVCSKLFIAVIIAGVFATSCKKETMNPNAGQGVKSDNTVREKVDVPGKDGNDRIPQK